MFIQVHWLLLAIMWLTLLLCLSITMGTLENKKSFIKSVKKSVNSAWEWQVTMQWFWIIWSVLWAILLVICIINATKTANFNDLRTPLYDIKEIQMKEIDCYTLYDTDETFTETDRQNCLSWAKEELIWYVRESSILAVNQEEIDIHKQKVEAERLAAIAAKEQEIKDAIQLLQDTNVMSWDCLTTGDKK